MGMAPGRRDGPSWPSWGCPWEGDRKGGVPEGGTTVVWRDGSQRIKEPQGGGVRKQCQLLQQDQG